MRAKNDSAGKIIRELLDAVDCYQCPRLGDECGNRDVGICDFEQEIIERAYELGIEVPE